MIDMWIFTPRGLIMPSAIPAKFIPEGSDKTIQIRVRRRIDLEWFIDNCMPEGSCGEIIATPDMDYNFRAYCSVEDLAKGMAALAPMITYAKFKPESEAQFEGNKVYHDQLNSIWGIMTREVPAGGSWAAGKAWTYPKKGATSYANNHVWGKSVDSGYGTEDDLFLDELYVDELYQHHPVATSISAGAFEGLYPMEWEMLLDRYGIKGKRRRARITAQMEKKVREQRERLGINPAAL